jgi:hypothetical protein
MKDSKEFTHLTYTGLVVQLEHLKIETKLMPQFWRESMRLVIEVSKRKPRGESGRILPYLK